MKETYQPEAKIETSDVSAEFVNMNSGDFRYFLREQIKKNPSMQFSIIANWIDIQTGRKAKALMDQYSCIDSITIRATRAQYEEDINAFESGVKWEEIK